MGVIIMKINEEGLQLIKDFEGLMLYSYYDTVGVLTCGYGHTDARDLKYPMQITESTAEEWLKKDLEKFENNVNRINDKYNYDFNINQFSALVSFAFNIGSIVQLVKGGTRNKVEIADAMLQYNKAGDKILPGLVRRRLAEYNLFNKPVEPELIEAHLTSLKNGDKM